MSLLCLRVLAAVLVLWCSGVAHGNEVKIVPGIGVKQEYSDNILFESDNEQSDAITTVSPEVSVKTRGERTSGSLDLGVDAIYYWDLDELNSVDKDLKGSLKHKVTERAGFGVSAGYLEDSRRDRETEETGLVISGDRERMTGAVSGDYMFSEILMGEVSLSYTGEDLSGITDEENTSVNAAVTVSANLAEWLDNTMGSAVFSYTNYQSDETADAVSGLFVQSYDYERDYDIWRLTAGLSREVTELYSWYFQAGVSYLSSEEMSRSWVSQDGTMLLDTGDSRHTDSSWGGVFVGGVKYQGLYTTWGVSVAHDVSAASGTTGTTERSSVSGNVSRRLTEELRLSLSASCYLNRSDRELESDMDELTLSMTAGASYALSRDCSLSAYWTYTSVDDREADTTSSRNLVYVLFRKTFDISL